MQTLFRKFAQKTSEWMGSSWAFIVAVIIIGAWALLGPVFGFSDSWQLIINTGTTIVTFLMVFLIQNTQNRDAIATQIKLDELIRAVKGARTRLVHLEECTDEELMDLQEEFRRLHERLDRHHAPKTNGESGAGRPSQERADDGKEGGGSSKGAR